MRAALSASQAEVARLRANLREQELQNGVRHIHVYTFTYMCVSIYIITYIKISKYMYISNICMYMFYVDVYIHA